MVSNALKRYIYVVFVLLVIVEHVFNLDLRFCSALVDWWTYCDDLEHLPNERYRDENVFYMAFSCNEEPAVNLTKDMFDYTVTKKIYIKNCDILSIHERAFKCPRLEKLSITNSNLQTMSNNAFIGVKRLQYLNLSDNYIKDIADSIFQPLHYLKDLFLAANSIEAINEFAFVGTANLKTLTLDRNIIQVIHPFSLLTLRHLTFLNLSDNALAHIPNKLFKTLNKLLTLDLSRNRITHVRKMMFYGLKSLRNLNLTNNDVLVLDEDAFTHVNSEVKLLLPEIRQRKHEKEKFTTNKKDVSQLDKPDCQLQDEYTLIYDANMVATKISRKAKTMCSSAWIHCSPISQIETSTFESFTNLPSIHSVKCQMKNVKEKIYSNLGNLKSLIIPFNNISEIFEESVHGLKSILRINSKEKLLSNIKRNTFQGLTSLKQLFLSLFCPSVDLYFDDTKEIYEEICLPTSLPENIADTDLSVPDIDVRCSNDSKATKNSKEEIADPICTLAPNDGLDCQINSLSKDITKEERSTYKSAVLTCFPNNDCQRLDADTFIGFTNLLFIKIICPIYEIQENSFIGLENLFSLTVSGYNNTEFPRNVFKGFKRLAELNFQDNILEKVQMVVYDDLQSLSSLDLSNNRISEIQDNALKKLTKLRRIFMDNNKIKRITQYSFQGQLSLERLYLHHNLIETIHADAFRNLYVLAHLVLSNNKLTTIDGDLFLSNSQLDYLALAGNNISYIDDKTFQATVAITLIDLTNNSFTTINPKLFSGLHNLETVNFENNYLRNVDSSQLENINNVINLGTQRAK